jgi:hypothetical protein
LIQFKKHKFDDFKIDRQAVGTHWQSRFQFLKMKQYTLDQLNEAERVKYELLSNRFKNVKPIESLSTKDSDTFLRFLFGNHFDVDKCTELLTEALEFHQKVFFLLNVFIF